MTPGDEAGDHSAGDLRPAAGSRTSDPCVVRSGVVVRASDTRLWVRCDAATGCRACDAGLGCRGGLIGALAGRTRLLEVTRGTSRAHPGDHVQVLLPLAAVARAATLAYGSPLVGVLCGSALAAWFWPQAGDLATVVGAGLGFGLGAAFARRRLTRGSLGRRLRPRLVTGATPRDPRIL